MSRKRTGLRNRFRAGRSSNYTERRRENGQDRYGEYLNGKCVKEDVIAGRTMSALKKDTTRTVDSKPFTATIPGFPGFGKDH